MELNDLKNTWQNIATPVTAAQDIKNMLVESNHPVLKGIRRQIIIEVTAWTAFLLCYYTMFDGDRKPLWLNAVLVTCVLLPLVHNLMGYSFARYLVNGVTLHQSLKVYLAKVKAYAVISIASRVLFAVAFVAVFTYGLSLTTAKYYLMTVLGAVFLFQLWILYRLWAARVGKIKISLQSFQ